MHRCARGIAVAYALAFCTACGGEGRTDVELDPPAGPPNALAVAVANDAQLRLGLGRGAGRVDLDVVRVQGDGGEQAGLGTSGAAAPGDVLCLRALDGAGWPFLQAGVVSACGEGYFATQPRSPAEPITDVRALSERNASVAALLQQMRCHPVPPQTAVLWRHALAHLARFLETADAPSQRPAELASRRPHVPGAHPAAATPPVSGAGPTTALHPYLGPLDPVLARRGSPHERLEHPSLEFRQQIELYSKKVKAYLVVGRLTDIDHSAAHITVLSRRRGSEEAWQPFAETWTRNHGTPATDPSMHHYATCDELPVTAGYFAWTGECPGKWGEAHVCNDDTRYQLWHAYGGWHDTPFCAETFHGTRPTCRKPW